MALPEWPDDSWGKDKYKEDIRRWRKDMSRVKSMSCVRNRRLEQNKIACLNNIVALITESETILKNSGTRLSKKKNKGSVNCGSHVGIICMVF